MRYKNTIIFCKKKILPHERISQRDKLCGNGGDTTIVGKASDGSKFKTTTNKENGIDKNN